LKWGLGAPVLAIGRIEQQESYMEFFIIDYNGRTGKPTIRLFAQQLSEFQDN